MSSLASQVRLDMLNIRVYLPKLNQLGIITYRAISHRACWFLTYSSTSCHTLPSSAVFYDTVPVKVGPCSLLPCKPTLNKMSQDCSVIQYPVKSLPKIFETDGFSTKVYVCALNQHCTSNFLVECCLLECLDNIYKTMFLGNVILPWSAQHCIGYLPHESCILAMGQHSTSTFLMQFGQIDPDKTVDYFPVQSCLWTLGHHYTGKFFVQCWHMEIRQHCISYFPAKTCLRVLGQH